MDLSKKKKIEMYETMVRIREFESCIGEMATCGSISGFVHLYIGEEAVATGVCAALKDSDYISSTHRGHGHVIAKGLGTDRMMAELLAKKTGYCKGKGGSMHIADMEMGILGANGIVGGGPPLAVGAALAQSYKGTDNVVACFFGDGASNQGTVHEAMNLASVWRLPVIFVVENNGVAEMTCQIDYLCIENVSERADGYKIPAAVVDGNDVMAVYKAATDAVLRARKGEGPSIVECKTYRTEGHFIGDPEVYREQSEVDEWRKPEKDPILRFEKKLLQSKALRKKDIEQIRIKIKDEIKQAVAFAEESPDPEVGDLLTDVYA